MPMIRNTDATRSASSSLNAAQVGNPSGGSSEQRSAIARQAGSIARNSMQAGMPTHAFEPQPLDAAQEVSNKFDLTTDPGKDNAIKQFEKQFSQVCKTLRGHEARSLNGVTLLDDLRSLIVVKKDTMPMPQQEEFRRHCQHHLDTKNEGQDYKSVFKRATKQFTASLKTIADRNKPLFTLTELKGAIKEKNLSDSSYLIVGSKSSNSKNSMDDFLSTIEIQSKVLKEHVEKAVGSGTTTLGHCHKATRIGEMYSTLDMEAVEIAGQVKVKLAEHGVISKAEIDKAVVRLFAEYLIDPGEPQDTDDKKIVPGHRAKLIDTASVVTHSQVGVVVSSKNDEVHFLHLQRFWGSPENRVVGQLKSDPEGLKDDLSVAQKEHYFTKLLESMKGKT